MRALQHKRPVLRTAWNSSGSYCPTFMDIAVAAELAVIRSTLIREARICGYGWGGMGIVPIDYVWTMYGSNNSHSSGRMKQISHIYYSAVPIMGLYDAFMMLRLFRMLNDPEVDCRSDHRSRGSRMDRRAGRSSWLRGPSTQKTKTPSSDHFGAADESQDRWKPVLCQ